MLPKIVKKEDKEKKEQRMQVFFAIFMAVILGASTIGFALSSSDSEVKKYNGIKFYRTEQGWQGKDLGFATTYLPNDVENITMEGIPELNTFLAKLYVVSDPENPLGIEWYEWANAVPMRNPNPACLPEDDNKEGCAELPLKSCEDADFENAVLIFNYGNETSVKANGRCLEISGDDLTLIQAVDKVIYVMYDVISP